MLKSRPLAYLSALALVGGSLSVISKLALEHIPAFGFISARFFISWLILTGALLILSKRIAWSKVKAFLPVAACWWTASLLFALGLQRTNATTAQFIHAFIPVAVVLFAAWLLGQRYGRRQWAGVGVAIVGVTVIILSKGSLTLSNDNLLGNLLVLASALGFAIYAVYSKLPRYEHLDALDMTYIGVTSGLIVSVPVAIVEYASHPWLGTISASAWVAVVLAGVAMTLFFGGSQLLIKKIGPAYMSLNQYLIPVFVIVWAAIILDELPAPIALGGAAVALVGVWMVTKPSNK